MLIEEKIGGLLLERRYKLACAESCTGGLVSDRITNIPGSSAYFPGGVVAYSYESKAKLLGVSWDALNSFGAVSEQVVIQMARGARNLFEADVAISVSGIAGPGGGTPEKPVGTTCIGLAAIDGEWTRHFIWNGDREQNKHFSSDAVLQLLLDYLEGKLK
jgi:nicotinamide-nucleotide amidase